MEMRITPPWGKSFETVESVKHVVSGLPSDVCDTKQVSSGPLMHKGLTESWEDVPNPPIHV